MFNAIKRVEDFVKWLYHMIFSSFTRGRVDIQAAETNVSYHELSLPGYELTDKHIQGSRATRKMPKFSAESGTHMTYGEGHHGS